jgi:hypothetical protein
VAQRIEFEVGEAEIFAATARSAPQNRADASEQFRKSEGFYKVIVGSQIEPLHPIGNGIPSGQKKHRRLLARAPQFCHNGPTVSVRKHDVQDEEIVFRILGQIQTILAIAGEIRDVSVLRQPLAKVGSRLRLVFYDQHFHVES